MLNEMIEQLKKMLNTDPSYKSYMDDQLVQLYKEISGGEILQSQEIGKAFWQLVCDERLGRAAFCFALTGDEKIAKWIKDNAIYISRCQEYEWVGENLATDKELVGNLFTSHICRGLSSALLFCPQIFCREELLEIKESLVHKGIKLLDRYLEPRMTDLSRSRNNWCVNLLCGAVAASLAVGDIEKAGSYIPFFNELHFDYNSDFYGECVGYWTYSLAAFLSVRMLCRLTAPKLLESMVDEQIVLRPFIWAYYHRQGYFKLQNSDKYGVRGLTFGDCNTIWEVVPITILYISIYHEDEMVRALASDCFEEPFANNESSADPYQVMMLWPFRKKRSKDVSFLPPSKLFGDGYLMYKDKWENPSIQIAARVGVSEVPKTSAHQHADRLSFQLAKDGVVIFDDPSRCCYRLYTQTLSASSAWHSTPFFITEEGKKLEQVHLYSKFYRAGKYDRLEYSKISNRAFVAVARAEDIYPDEITDYTRTFVGVDKNILVLIDSYKASVPVREGVSFVGNNRDSVMECTLGVDRGTFVREGVGAVALALQSSLLERDYAALHDGYRNTPNSAYQGRDGSGYILKILASDMSTSDRNCYVVFADKSDMLVDWKAELCGDSIAISKGSEMRYTIELADKIKVFEGGNDLLS